MTFDDIENTVGEQTSVRHSLTYGTRMVSFS